MRRRRCFFFSIVCLDPIELSAFIGAEPMRLKDKPACGARLALPGKPCRLDIQAFSNGFMLNFMRFLEISRHDEACAE
jgi:hypothetical protein